MPRAGQRLKTRKAAAVKPAGPAHKGADALAHNRLARYMEEHFEWMLVSGYSPETIRARRQAIRKFIAWADERGLDDPREVTRPMLERYQQHLFYLRKADGTPLTVGMQVQYLAPLKTWFRWLARGHHILANPAADLDLPKQPKRLPRSVPTVQEVEAMLAEAEPTNAQGVRDRALLEVLYATGLRRMEIVGVAIYDVDLPRGLLWVRKGKGNRQRVVPIGDRNLTTNNFSADGVVASNGTLDLTMGSDYTNTGTGLAALAMTPHPAWLAGDGLAQWIGFTGSGSDSVNAGTFTYRTTFDLAGYDTSTASVTVVIATS